jgi:hypothetical protein
MAVVKAKPTSAGRRFVVQVVDKTLHKGAPYKPLLDSKSKPVDVTMRAALPLGIVAVVTSSITASLTGSASKMAFRQSSSVLSTIPIVPPISRS